MNGSFLKSALVALTLSFGLAAQALAVPITGSLFINGSDVMTDNNAALGSSTKIISIGTATVTAPTDGDYAGTVGAAVSYAGFTFWPAMSVVNPLWSFTSGGMTYTFDLTTLTVDTRSNTKLALSGLGTLNISGGAFDPTAGAWEFAITNAGGGAKASFAFTSSAAALPDGGTTAMLLGFGLTGLALLARARKFV